MSDTTIPVITLDGPSGTGKGTLCHLVAQHLHWHVLDSGALYRVLAYAARKAGIPLDAAEQLAPLAYKLDLQFLPQANNKTSIILDKEEISQALRLEQCGQDASAIATYPLVREALLQRQRDFAQLPGLVTDGRDMGTVVFPDAVLKVFLSASPEERAKRRYLQLKEQGIDASLQQVVEELVKRDTRDSARSIAPLKPSEDAVFLETTGLTIVQVFNSVLQLLNERRIFTSSEPTRGND